MKTTYISLLMLLLSIFVVPEKVFASRNNNLLSLNFFSAALQENNTVMAEWETNDDKSYTCFVLQHSTDGFVFDTLGVVISSSLSPDKIKYNHLHNAPAEGVNFYRLVQIGLSGTPEYSQVVVIEIEKKKPGKFELLNAYPVPVDDELNVSVFCPEKTDLTVTVLGTNGKVVYTQTLQCAEGKGVIKLNAENLSRGNQYTVILTDKTGSKAFRRIIKR